MAPPDNSVSPRTDEPRSPSGQAPPFSPSGQAPQTYEELEKRLGRATAERELREKAERFLQELPNILKCMDSTAAWANEHETVFTKFRRGCLDASASPFLEAAFYSIRDMESVWLFLMEVARQHPRAMRKNLGECARILGVSYSWSIVLRGSLKVTAALQGLPEEIRQNFIEDTGCEGASGGFAAALAPAAGKATETTPRSRPVAKKAPAPATPDKKVDAGPHRAKGPKKETIEAQLRGRDEIAALKKENRELREAQKKRSSETNQPAAMPTKAKQPATMDAPSDASFPPLGEDGWPPQSEVPAAGATPPWLQTGAAAPWPEPTSPGSDPWDAHADPSQSYNPFRKQRPTSLPEPQDADPPQHLSAAGQGRQSKNLFVAALQAFSPIQRPASPRCLLGGPPGPRTSPLYALAQGAFSPLDQFAEPRQSGFSRGHRPATHG